MSNWVKKKTTKFIQIGFVKVNLYDNCNKICEFHTIVIETFYKKIIPITS